MRELLQKPTLDTEDAPDTNMNAPDTSVNVRVTTKTYSRY
ncbi:634_t:CDS:2 [Dentiscutata erythropus]|uniref:634_t:CDS:1 n=1 Tax=Dentiscutata erythropus TaxID=1348616 RepID=A0A9N9BEJ4_9GLOM|nr:634_t:CDS:2 [Dentiscutata erythropus]